MCKCDYHLDFENPKNTFYAFPISWLSINSPVNNTSNVDQLIWNYISRKNILIFFIFWNKMTTALHWKLALFGGCGGPEKDRLK
jgi:hypothetical protein